MCLIIMNVFISVFQCKLSAALHPPATKKAWCLQATSMSWKPQSSITRSWGLSTVQYSTAQYSTAQHSTVQYSTSLLRGRCLVTSVAAGRSGSLREGRNMTQPELSPCR